MRITFMADWRGVCWPIFGPGTKHLDFHELLDIASVKVYLDARFQPMADCLGKSATWLPLDGH